ncbi:MULTISPECIES: hercynine metabolism small protein [Prochlorococcus]|uniref:hercynine metabolism small protein n=1 Tax=Prochlorococcus TaxID=1218 RepID=UPI00053371E3|nr:MULTISPECIES: hercynine metabolism small protein [Prochlorococcus]KGG13646.1 hypothetical protein EV05_0303 [Prochlorococcus sp. MIT 0601]
MSREQQLKLLKDKRKAIIQDLEIFYQNAFNEISKLNVAEGDIAKLCQLLLLSKEAALGPMQKEIERPLITNPANDVRESKLN